MSRLRMLGFVLAVLLVGCQAPEKSLPPPATAFTAERMQVEFQRIDPSARVGLVAAVMPADRLAAVSHFDPTDFHAGESISFIDSRKDIIGAGTVVRTVDDLVVVRYERITRALRQGDLAVRVKP
jgi:hypothetical protein